jgi:hypothetical protein
MMVQRGLLRCSHQTCSTAVQFASLQGLAQAFFQFYAIGSAGARTMAILQKQLELAMRNWPKLNDTLYVDDGGPMNPDKSHGIEMAGEFVQCAGSWLVTSTRGFFNSPARRRQSLLVSVDRMCGFAFAECDTENH